MVILKKILGFVIFLTCGLGVSLGLWLVMSLMIAPSGKKDDTNGDLKPVEFVRLKREDPPKIKDREIPQKPPPPKKPPPPPKMDIADMEKPDQEPLDINMPNLDLPAPGVGGGPAMGGYQTGSQSRNRDRVPRFRVSPIYPRKARLEGIEGFVRFKIDITAEGTVTNVRFIDENPRKLFRSSAHRAVLKWRYDPLIVDGEAQPDFDQVVTLDFVFGEE